MNAQRLLVLQADDFGSSNAANRGVVRAFTQGCLTQSNLMAPCAWFGEAAKLAKEHGIPVGVHVTLTCEYPEYHFGPLTGAKALTRKGAPTAFLLATNDLPAEADDAVYEEVAAQIERVLAAGIKPTHLDAHMGAFPRWDGAFAKAALRIWERFRIPFLRLPEKAGLPAELAPLNAQGFKMGRGSLAERKPAFRAALRAAPPRSTTRSRTPRC